MFRTILALLLVFGSDSVKASSTCGGFVGAKCPNGEECVMGSERFPDQAGSCRPIDLKALRLCLKFREVSAVCRTEEQCTQQKNRLGDLGKDIRFSVDKTLHTRGLDPGIAWFFPGRDPYPFVSQELGGTAVRAGQIDLGGLKYISGCSSNPCRPDRPCRGQAVAPFSK